MTTRTATRDPLAEHLQAVRDEALANARDLLTQDGPAMREFPRRLQIEQSLVAAESAQRRLDLFGETIGETK